MFHEYICKMYILADMKWNCKKSRFIGTKTTVKKDLDKKYWFFYLKDFIDVNTKQLPQ